MKYEMNNEMNDAHNNDLPLQFIAHKLYTLRQILWWLIRCLVPLY